MRMRVGFIGVSVAMLGLLTSRTGRPDDEKKASYAEQIVAVDGGAVLFGALLQSPIAFAASYALGAPIVHWAHGHALEGFESLGLRVVVPVVMAFAMRAATDDADGGAAVGAFGGALFVTTFDAAVLARTPQRSLLTIAGTF